MESIKCVLVRGKNVAHLRTQAVMLLRAHKTYRLVIEVKR